MGYNIEFEDLMDNINNIAQGYGFINGIDWARMALNNKIISYSTFKKYENAHILRNRFSHGNARDINVSYETYQIAKSFENKIKKSSLRKNGNNNGYKSKNGFKRYNNSKYLNIKVGGIIEFGSYPQTKDGDTFKVEPIKWRVLEINNGKALLLSEKILDAHMFAEESNNYANSEIRRWLNNEFYNEAFNDEEKSRIVTTNVDNSIRSTYPNGLSEEELKECWDSGKNKYACDNTNDKIFLLSQQEVTKKEYGFSSAPFSLVYDKIREKQGTDYAKSQDLYVNPSYGSPWWLRSPFYDESYSAQSVGISGNSNCIDNVSHDESGVVPAMKIKLS